MRSSILKFKTFFKIFNDIDFKFSNNYKVKLNCKYCNSSLHSADYLRKPKGTLVNKSEITKRYSFTCSLKKCRRRNKPPSIRYFKQFHYHLIYFLFIGYLIEKKVFSIPKINKEYNISISTLYRWRNYWNNKFKNTSLYQYFKTMLINTEYLLSSIFENTKNFILISIKFMFNDPFKLGPEYFPQNLAIVKVIIW